MPPLAATHELAPGSAVTSVAGRGHLEPWSPMWRHPLIHVVVVVVGEEFHLKRDRPHFPRSLFLQMP